jgi:hypothetical protein
MHQIQWCGLYDSSSHGHIQCGNYYLTQTLSSHMHGLVMKSCAIALQP